MLGQLQELLNVRYCEPWVGSIEKLSCATELQLSPEVRTVSECVVCRWMEVRKHLCDTGEQTSSKVDTETEGQQCQFRDRRVAAARLLQEEASKQDWRSCKRGGWCRRAREKGNVSLLFKKNRTGFQMFNWKAEDQKCLKVWGFKNLSLGCKENF